MIVMTSSVAVCDGRGVDGEGRSVVGVVSGERESTASSLISGSPSTRVFSSFILSPSGFTSVGTGVEGECMVVDRSK